MSRVDGLEHMLLEPPEDDTMFTRRQYMARRLIMSSGAISLAQASEAVNAVAQQHPDWDMEERHTWPEWEAMRTGRKTE